MWVGIIIFDILFINVVFGGFFARYKDAKRLTAELTGRGATYLVPWT